MQHIFDRRKTYGARARRQIGSYLVRRGTTTPRLVIARGASNHRVLPGRSCSEFVVDDNWPSAFEY